MYWLRLGQHQPTSMSATPSQYFATWPLLGQYFTNTQPTLCSLTQLLLLSSIFSTQLREAFSGRHPFLAFNSSNIHVFQFSSYVFSLLLYTTLVTFASSSIWGFLLSEVCYFRGAKDDISVFHKKNYNAY